MRTNILKSIRKTLNGFGILRKPLPNGLISEGMFRWNDPFAGTGLNSKCYLRIYSKDGRIIALAQQLKNVVTVSITNDVENLAGCVFEMCQREYGLRSVMDFQWIQYYPKEANLVWKDSYSLVDMKWDGKKFADPEWHHTTYGEINRVIGQPPPKSLMKKERFAFSESEENHFLCLLEKALSETQLPPQYEKLRDAHISEFALYSQDRGGLYLFGHSGQKVVLHMTGGGELFFPNT